MSRKAIKKSLNRSFRKSAEYSAALMFAVLFLVSSMYSLPNFSVSKVGSNSNETKNLKASTTSRLDSSYRRYCDSDDHNGNCNFIAINTDALSSVPFTATFYQIHTTQTYSTQLGQSLSIRAPPRAV